MEEIKVGDYIRTESGIIEKIKTFDEYTNIFIDEKGKLQKWLGETVFREPYSEEITKHSRDIKDLIELRDFVNEMIVDKDCNGLICTDINGDFHYLDKIQIKTILTHEMYEQNCYKVGDIE